MNDEMPWVNLTQEEVIDLRNKKFELTQYGKEKLRKLMNNKPISAKVSTEDYNKVMDAINQKQLTHEEMLEIAEKREAANKELAKEEWEREQREKDNK